MAGKNTVIIGSGISGLSSACLLAKAGHSVTVVDRLSKPGGVARSRKMGDYVFDTGPTWYLMPEVFEHFFSQVGTSPAQHYDLVPLDPSYRIMFEDDEAVVITRDHEQVKSVFDGFEKDGGKKLDQYLKNSGEKYDIAMKQVLYHDYVSVADFMKMKFLLNGMRMGVFKSLEGFVNSYFSDHRSKKVVQFNTVFLGSSPAKTPALYSLMSHADMTIGVYYPIGGIVSLVRALYDTAAGMGVKFHFDTAAKKILIKDKKALGVETDNGTIKADIVLSTTDYHHADNALVETEYRNYTEEYWSGRVMAPSALLMYLGVNKKLENLAHHNFYIARDWENHFRHIFTNPAWPEDPCYYVGCPSKTDSTVAPDGCESVFILVPLGAGLEDKEEDRQAFADGIISHLEKQLGQSIHDSIVEKKLVCRRDFESDLNLYRGTALGLAHTLRQTAVFRPSHFNKKVPNLYYAGHYTQPGIGMPMVIIGAELVCGRIVKDHPSS